jgi:hypothetical protein
LSTWSIFSKAQIQAGAKSANEQQNTPSKKSCKSKIHIVIFRTNQRTSEVFTINSFRVVKTLLNWFQQKPSPFKLIAFVGS